MRRFFRVRNPFLILLLLVFPNTACHNAQQNQASAPSTNEIRKKSSAYDGLLTVEVGGKYGFVDRTGKVVINPQFDSVSQFSEGLAVVCLGKCEFFANQIHPDESKYGYIDESGKFVVNPQFDYALDFSGGLAPVCMGDCGYRPVAPRKWGYIDVHGNTAVALQFGDANPFAEEGLAAVCVGKCSGEGESWEGKWGYVDKTGKLVISPQFDNAFRFESGVALVFIGKGKNPKRGYIDKTGAFIWNPTN